MQLSLSLPSLLGPFMSSLLFRAAASVANMKLRTLVHHLLHGGIGDQLHPTRAGRRLQVLPRRGGKVSKIITADPQNSVSLCGCGEYRTGSQ